MELSKEDVTKLKHHLTVGDLKKFLSKNNLPDDAKVLIERVEDVYYDEHHWGVYLKDGEHYHNALQYNADVDSGKYLDKEEYPNITEENLVKYTEEDLHKMKVQYHPAWACVGYSDDKDILFIDLHY